MQQEVDKGGKLVHFEWTVSLLFVTFRRRSQATLIRAGENAASKSLPYTLISLLFGWWGFPWGPRDTIRSIRTNLRGGSEVTDEVMAVMAGYMLYEEVNARKES
ncbi:hypothetical protein JMG10_02845 [Nostoc ellipsosporum NOK]|nr:hypothetical protein [Nostoc ellipsosporum NOK]